MKSVLPTNTNAEQKKITPLTAIEPAALDDMEQQSIVTTVNEINNAAAKKKKGYKEGNKNDSDTVEGSEI